MPIVIDMEMPESCPECSLRYTIALPEQCYKTGLTIPFSIRYGHTIRRPDWCPLRSLALLHTGSLSRMWEEKLHLDAATVEEEL